MNLPSRPGEDARRLPPWLASALLKRGDLAPRFVYWRQRLARQSRGWRRRLQRQLAVGVTGAALLLAVAGARAQIDPAAPDNAMTVVNGQVGVVANGQCSLIEAIQNANNKTTGRPNTDCAAGNPNGADTINLPNNGTFTLTSAFVTNTDVGAIGLPWISSTITINGNGSTIQRDSAAPEFRIMAIGRQGNLSLNSTTISNGYLHLEASDDESCYSYSDGDIGAGILNQGELRIVSSIVRDNLVSGKYCSVGGGGIGNLGLLTITDSSITNNEANTGYYAVSFGGGISNAGTLTITGSIIAENIAYSYLGDSDGGGIDNQGTLTVSRSTIRDNIADAFTGATGGGIYDSGTTIIDDSTVRRNTTGARDAYGGGIYSSGWLTITNSRIEENEAGGQYERSGGGLFAKGLSSISGSTFTDNRAGSPQYYFNCCNANGAIANFGNMTLSNSTLSNNENDQGGSAIGNFNSLAIANSTITGNEGGVLASCNVFTHSTSTTQLSGTIISGNGSYEVLRNQTSDCTAIIAANTHNLFGHNGNSGVTGFTPGPTDIVPTVGLSAILSPLTNNGGPTQTHALPPGSPALDRAPNSSCTAAPVNGVDQRGQPRNQNGSGASSANECDVGAFERGGGSPPPVGAFFLSPGTAGTVGGVAFAPADIIKFDPASGWSMVFDGSDVGITKNLTAFELQSDSSILLSLGAPQAVAGVGSVAAHDVLRFTPSQTGPNTAGAFQMWVDGSNVGLTTSAERIDALGLTADGRIAISTFGAVAVAGPGGATLKAANEDALGFNRTNATWSTFFDPTSVPGMGPENVNALWVNPATGEIYIALADAFNLGGVSGDARDIVKLTPSGGSYTPSLYWDGSAAGFPVAIDGLEMSN